MGIKGLRVADASILPFLITGNTNAPSLMIAIFYCFILFFLKFIIIFFFLTLLRKGIKGLRVADASIMPFLITGNTNAPSMMIGRKAADLIRKERADLAGKCQVEKQTDNFEINSCFPYQNDI